MLGHPVKVPTARTRACGKRPAAEEAEQYPGGRQLRKKDLALACSRGRKLSGSQRGSLQGPGILGLSTPVPALGLLPWPCSQVSLWPRHHPPTPLTPPDQCH